MSSEFSPPPGKEAGIRQQPHVLWEGCFQGVSDHSGSRAGLDSNPTGPAVCAKAVASGVSLESE